jgi:hypothetical protein
MVGRAATNPYWITRKEWNAPGGMWTRRSRVGGTMAYSSTVKTKNKDKHAWYGVLVWFIAFCIVLIKFVGVAKWIFG